MLRTMRVGRGDAVLLRQPMTGLIVITRADEATSGGRALGQALMSAEMQSAVVADLRLIWGAQTLASNEGCGLCRQWTADQMYSRVAVCAICEREVADLGVFRRRRPEAELSLGEV
jgi:hypothetical protein